MFITFEGIDGSGKTTQINILTEYLESQGKEVLQLREPGGAAPAEKIRELLLYSKDEISPIAELLLFNAARNILTEKVIRPALSQGKIVICDRFFDSTTAYQGYGRGINLESVETCNMLGAGGLAPNLTFYLHIPYSVSMQRGAGIKPDRMESAGSDFFEKVINGFESLARAHSSRIIKIDGAAEANSVAEIVRQKTMEYINTHN